MKLLQLFKSKKEKSAAIYDVNGRIVVVAVPKTTAGVRIESDPQAITKPVKVDDLAVRLRRALEASSRTIPHPAQKEWKGLFQPIAKAAGVRSWKAFADSARSISIRETADGITLTPQQSNGAKEGFEPLVEQRVTVSSDVQLVAQRVLDHFSDE